MNSLKVLVYMCMNMCPAARNLMEELGVLQIPSPLLFLTMKIYHKLIFLLK